MKPDLFDVALAGIPEWFWECAARVPRLLVVDYDGTMAPFRTDPCQAVPLQPAVNMLRAIAASGNTTVAVVSGRVIGEMEALLPAPELLFAGENGWEEKAPGRRLARHRISPEHTRALGRAAAAATLKRWGARIERKRASLMLHTRGVPREEAAEMERSCAAVWSAEGTRAGLRMDFVKGGVTLAAPGRDKGTYLRDLLSRSPAGTVPVHIGDDVSDEAAFKVIEGSGLGIRVGEPTEPSLAHGRLRSWLDVPVFLSRWLEVLEARRIPGFDTSGNADPRTVRSEAGLLL